MKPWRVYASASPISHRSKTCKEIAKNFTREWQHVKKSQISLHDISEKSHDLIVG